MYLGDGSISRHQRAYVLRVFLHHDQSDVIERVCAAIATLLPTNRVSSARRRGTAVVVVRCYSQQWPLAFPQHGAGRKHMHRRIVRGRNYPAYSFSNRSEDILGLFGWACDLVGVRWRRANRVTISVARRADVARLDAMLGYGGV
jgi:hypothetical protein